MCALWRFGNFVGQHFANFVGQHLSFCLCAVEIAINCVNFHKVRFLQSWKFPPSETFSVCLLHALHSTHLLWKFPEIVEISTNEVFSIFVLQTDQQEWAVSLKPLSVLWKCNNSAAVKKVETLIFWPARRSYFFETVEHSCEHSWHFVLFQVIT